MEIKNFLRLGALLPGRQQSAHHTTGRDWTILLCACALLIILVAVLAAVLYWQNATPLVEETPALQANLLTQQKLQNFLARYQVLGEEHAQLLQHAPAIADPAIPK